MAAFKGLILMLPVATIKPLIHTRFMPLATSQPVTRKRQLFDLSSIRFCNNKRLLKTVPTPGVMKGR